MISHTEKVSSFPDKCFYHTVNILRILNKIGEKNIILKLKFGNYDIAKIKKLYEDYISLHKLKNISVQIGKMDNFLSHTKLIIGQSSSAIYEVCKNNIDYHIYEPNDLGLSFNEIKKSTLFNLKLISRNEKDLLKNLKKKNKSSLIKSQKQIFKGQKISNNFFND